MEKVIKDILRSLSINCKYRGYQITVAACELLMEDESLLFNVSRDLYPKIAKRCGCSATAIERNIRTVVFRAWENNLVKLIEIAGYNLQEPPTVTEFLGLLITYMQREELKV